MKNKIFLILTFVILISGCAASRQSQFYILSSEVKPAATALSAKYSVTVGPVTVPAAVDRPQIVLQTGQNQVFLSEFDRWASPLKGDIARVVADNLIKLLGTRQVSLFSQSAAADATYQVTIDVVHFESEPHRAATLDALWMIMSGKSVQIQSRTTVTEPVQDGGYAELVAAHSRAIGRLSAEIADAIRKLGSN